MARKVHASHGAVSCSSAQREPLQGGARSEIQGLVRHLAVGRGLSQYAMPPGHCSISLHALTGTRLPPPTRQIHRAGESASHATLPYAHRGRRWLRVQYSHFRSRGLLAQRRRRRHTMLLHPVKPYSPSARVGGATYTVPGTKHPWSGGVIAVANTEGDHRIDDIRLVCVGRGEGCTCALTGPPLCYLVCSCH